MAWKIVCIFICSLFLCIFASAFADYKDPVMRTNVNEQTDLFKESIEGWDKVQDEGLKEQKARLKNLSAASEVGTIKGKVEYEEENQSVQANSNKMADMSYEEAESGGRNKMLEENTIEELYVDYTKPLNKAYLEDAKDFARMQDEFVKNNLTSKLKELGIDCKSVKGNKIVEPEFYLQSINQPEESHSHGIGKGDTRYDQGICELLRNSYQCHDELTMRCQRFSEKEFDKIKFVSSDIEPNYSSSSGISNYYFATNCVGSTSRGGKKPHFFKRVIGKSKKSYETHIAGSEEFGIYFDINDDMAVINRLELSDIHYNGIMSISINGRIINVLPIGGSSLNIVGSHEIVTKKKKLFRKKKKYQTYSVISNGYSNYMLTPSWNDGDSGGNIQHVLGNQSHGYINLQDYARRGRNELRIKIISLDGYVRFNFRISERICLEWQEIWDEKCQLQ